MYQSVHGAQPHVYIMSVKEAEQAAAGQYALNGQILSKIQSAALHHGLAPDTRMLLCIYIVHTHLYDSTRIVLFIWHAHFTSNTADRGRQLTVHVVHVVSS